MLHHNDNYGFSLPVVFHSKAPREDNGHSIIERGNAVVEHLKNALRVSLSTLTDGVAPLNKGITIVSETRLAVNVDKLTEHATIVAMEH